MYSEKQYTLPDFPYSRFSPEEEYLWARLEKVRTGEPVYVPVDFLFPGRLGKSRPLGRASTNGCAVHYNNEEAIRAAVLELIERDAMAIVFLSRMKVPRLDVRENKEGMEKIRAMEREDFEVVVLDLELDIKIPTVLIIGFRQGGSSPYLLRGAGSGPHRQAAFKKALGEIWRSFLFFKRWPLSMPRLHEVSPYSVEFNLAYYQNPMARKMLGFLFDAEEGKGLLEKEARNVDCDPLKVLHEKGFEVFVRDCTLPHVARLGFKCFKVMVPGLVPVSFGKDPVPCGLRRLFEVPVFLSRTPRILREEDLSPYPHFFS